MEHMPNKIILDLTRSEANGLYADILQENDKDTLRYFAQNDLFFLLTVVCKKGHIDNEWGYARCREVQKNPYGYVDVWAREHYKSTIKTFGLIIFEILRDPERTHCIFSHTKPMAKAFFDEIRRELETNELIFELFPNIFTHKEAEYPTWSEEKGLTVLRKCNRKESTLNISGLTDGMATGMHYDCLHFDDIVVIESVRTPDMMSKTDECFRNSLNLTAIGGKISITGTRYHFADLLGTLIEEGEFLPRIYPATQTGFMFDKDGNYVGGKTNLMSVELLKQKYRTMGSYVFGCQMLQQPLTVEDQVFRREWLKFYENMPDITSGRRVLLVDPSGGQGKKSDYTCIWVACYMNDDRWYFIDGIRERLNLTQRADKVMFYARKYRVERIGYEQYGLQADIEYLEKVMDRERERFSIVKVGGGASKVDRVKRLVPKFETGQILLPRRLLKVDPQQTGYDMVKLFIDLEYLRFPLSSHDDMIDCMSRILDVGIKERTQDSELLAESLGLNPIKKCRNVFNPI